MEFDNASLQCSGRTGLGCHLFRPAFERKQLAFKRKSFALERNRLAFKRERLPFKRNLLALE